MLVDVKQVGCSGSCVVGDWGAVVVDANGRRGAW